MGHLTSNVSSSSSSSSASVQWCMLLQCVTNSGLVCCSCCRRPCLFWLLPGEQTADGEDLMSANTCSMHARQ